MSSPPAPPKTLDSTRRLDDLANDSNDTGSEDDFGDLPRQLNPLPDREPSNSSDEDEQRPMLLQRVDSNDSWGEEAADHIGGRVGEEIEPDPLLDPEEDAELLLPSPARPEGNDPEWGDVSRDRRMHGGTHRRQRSDLNQGSRGIIAVAWEVASAWCVLVSLGS